MDKSLGIFKSLTQIIYDNKIFSIQQFLAIHGLNANYGDKHWDEFNLRRK